MCIKVSSFFHDSQPGVVLLLMYQQKCTAVYCCVQPTRSATGERRRASENIIHTGSGISYVQRISDHSINTHNNQVRYSINITWYSYCVYPRIINTSVGGRGAAGERRRASDVCAHSKYSSGCIVVVLTIGKVQY